MGTMTKKKSSRRSFTPGYKADIVQACKRGDRTIREVADSFDLHENLVRKWVVDADKQQNGPPPMSDDERAELVALRKENRQLREDNGILKRATAFFAKEIR